RYLHTMVYGESIMSPQVQYASKLAEVLGPGLDCVYFGNSGAEANEGALKVAKRFTGRNKIVAFHNSYHGSTHGALSVTGSSTMKQGYGPLLPQVTHLPYNDFAALEQIDSATAAVIIEAIQGAGGVMMPAEGYLQAVRKRCDDTGALLILDEIQTGFGRTGHLFAHQGLGFKPDILTLAKALGGGLPLGAFVTRAEIVSVIQANPVLGHINTFGGGPVSCAAGLALLNKILDENLMASIPAKEAILCHELRHPAIKQVRGKGLLMAAIFDDAASSQRVLQACLKRGLLTIGFLNINNGLRIAPPLTITEEQLREACRLFVGAVEEALG
ncbi:MAG: aspartate aminotransferase family protein, partial [Bacteroidota bacterium]